MKWVRAIVSLVLAAAAFWALDNRHGTFPALGRLLNPFAGFWQNGGRSDTPPERLTVPGLREEVRVAWDDHHVPHIFARNDHDLFLAQGYVAAYLRLWQMDFQSLYTAGRISEVVGRAGLRQDIFTRRFGLPWAAERALRAFRSDPKTSEALEAFTAGVNARIAEIGRKGLPVEYKILDYRPEPWTELKCALLPQGHGLLPHVLQPGCRHDEDEEVGADPGGRTSTGYSRSFPRSSTRSSRRARRSTSRRFRSRRTEERKGKRTGRPDRLCGPSDGRRRHRTRAW